jgi:hypothetical protein
MQEASVSPTPAPVPTADLRDVICTAAEAAKIERFVGIEKDAGMSDAIKWADSDDKYVRRFSCAVFKDIGTPEAAEYLRTLSNDSSGLVASIAKGDLAEIGRPPTPYDSVLMITKVLPK